MLLKEASSSSKIIDDEFFGGQGSPIDSGNLQFHPEQSRSPEPKGKLFKAANVSGFNPLTAIAAANSSQDSVPFDKGHSL